MSGNNERVSTEQVSIIANEIETYNKRLKEITSEGSDYFKQLSLYWKGEASQQSIENFNYFSTNYFEKNEKVIDSYVEFLRNNVSAGYEETENINKDLAAAYLDEEVSSQGSNGSSNDSSDTGTPESSEESDNNGWSGGTHGPQMEGSTKTNVGFEGNKEHKTYSDGKHTSESAAAIGASAGYGVKGSLWGAETHYDDGVQSFDASVDVGQVKSESEVGFEIDPESGVAEIYAETKSEVNAVHGEAEYELGSKDFGAGAEASGDLGHAELSGEARFGTDGAKLGGSAIACAAQGDVEGGINLFGWRIGAKASGYAGAIGIEGKVEASQSGVELDIGAAAALGGKVGISIHRIED